MQGNAIERLHFKEFAGMTLIMIAGKNFSISFFVVVGGRVDGVKGIPHEEQLCPCANYAINLIILPYLRLEINPSLCEQKEKKCRSKLSLIAAA